MHANSHHRPLLVVTVALQRGVATAAAVGPAQVHHLSLRLNRRKIPESPSGSPIPIGDGDGDVNRFPDGDGDGDGNEAEKRRWGW
ncbi:hypothetical protein Tco_1163669 [Tanacetum coccineum]